MIPKSTKQARIADNANVFDFTLDKEDVDVSARSRSRDWARVCMGWLLTIGPLLVGYTPAAPDHAGRVPGHRLGGHHCALSDAMYRHRFPHIDIYCLAEGESREREPSEHWAAFQCRLDRDKPLEEHVFRTIFLNNARVTTRDEHAIPCTLGTRCRQPTPAPSPACSPLAARGPACRSLTVPRAHPLQLLE